MKTGIWAYALLIIASLSGSICMAQTASIPLPKRGLCAHRGAMETHPENTIPAFQEAIRLGVHMIEFDIQLTKDSALVIMHDGTVDRTTNGKGKVSEMTLLEIRQLDAGIKKDERFAGVQVPTLEEVLALMPKNVWLNCHLKGGADLGLKSATALKKAGRLHQAFLTCGEAAAAAARTVLPSIMICNGENRYRQNTPVYVSATIDMKADFIQLLAPAKEEDRTELMARLKQNSVKINYYYAKKPEELKGLFNAGVDFVLVNNPASFAAAAKEMGIEPWPPQF
jgi:glycerophosphoryl diester phosphodiesterase